MSNKERELVAAITTERQQRPRGKTGQKNSDRALSKKQRPMKSKDPCSETINLGGGFGKAGDLVNINLDEALPPADEILGNEKVNNQLESDQFGFEGRHYPLSDPLKYNEPKLTVASGVQCNRCPRAFKTFTNLKQHMARSHKVDSSTSKEERSSVIKNEKERQSSLHNIPAHLVTEDLQRESFSTYFRKLLPTINFKNSRANYLLPRLDQTLQHQVDRDLHCITFKIKLRVNTRGVI